MPPSKPICKRSTRRLSPKRPSSNRQATRMATSQWRPIPVCRKPPIKSIRSWQQSVRKAAVLISAESCPNWVPSQMMAISLPHQSVRSIRLWTACLEIQRKPTVKARLIRWEFSSALWWGNRVLTWAQPGCPTSVALQRLREELRNSSETPVTRLSQKWETARCQLCQMTRHLCQNINMRTVILLRAGQVSGV